MFNFSPNSGDCSTATTVNSDSSLDTTLSEIYSPSWSSDGGDTFLGSRTRPASYGRASSWTDPPSSTSQIAQSPYINNNNINTSPTPSPTTTTNNGGNVWSFATNHDGYY